MFKTQPLAKIAAAGLAALLVAGCQPQPDTPRPGSQMVSTSEAIAYLDRICLPTKPSFAGAPERMLKNGLTIVKEGRHFHPVKAVSAKVDAHKNGRRICSVSATYPGDIKVLQDEMAAKYGRPNARDSVGPGLLTYRRGAKGKMVLFLGFARPGQTSRFEIAIVEGV